MSFLVAALDAVIILGVSVLVVWLIRELVGLFKS